MNIDDAIKRLGNYHPITREDEDTFRIAVDCMKFTRDFVPLDATPERMKRAIDLLNSLEHAFDAVRNNNGYVYLTADEGKLKEFKASRDRIDAAIERIKKYVRK